MLVRVVTAVPGVTSYSSSLTNLVPNIMYLIEVAAETRMGEGARAGRLVLMDRGINFISPPSFVSTKPLNSTGIVLSWGYPDGRLADINGSIIYHNVTGEGQLNVDLSLINNTTNQTHVFLDLMPFTYYEFSVASVSVSEIAETICSIPSDPAVTRTDEDCKLLKVCGMYSKHYEACSVDFSQFLPCHWSSLSKMFQMNQTSSLLLGWNHNHLMESSHHTLSPALCLVIRYLFHVGLLNICFRN